MATLREIIKQFVDGAITFEQLLAELRFRRGQFRHQVPTLRELYSDSQTPTMTRTRSTSPGWLVSSPTNRRRRSATRSRHSCTSRTVRAARRDI